MTTWTARFSDSKFTYPLSSIYLAGVAVAVCVSLQVLDLSIGLLALSVTSVLVLLLAQRNELSVVHVLVEGQLERLSVMSDMLGDAGITAPAGENVSRTRVVYETDVPAETYGTDPYQVRIYEAGMGAYCTCPVWRFHTQHNTRLRTCPHVEKVLLEHPEILSTPEGV